MFSFFHCAVCLARLGPSFSLLPVLLWRLDPFVLFCGLIWFPPLCSFPTLCYTWFSSPVHTCYPPRAYLVTVHALNSFFNAVFSDAGSFCLDLSYFPIFEFFSLLPSLCGIYFKLVFHTPRNSELLFCFLFFSVSWPQQSYSYVYIYLMFVAFSSKVFHQYMELKCSLVFSGPFFPLSLSACPYKAF